MTLFSLVVAIVTLALAAYLVFEGFRKDKLSQAFQKDISDQIANMSKDIKRWGDELSRTLDSLGAKSGDSNSRIADSIAGLNALENNLAQLVHALTNSSSDVESLRTKLTEAQSNVQALSMELDSAKEKAGKFEADFVDALRRIKEMEAAEAERRREKGIEPVNPDRDSIYEATQRAVDLAWKRGATPQALLAKKVAEEEGALIMRAFEAAMRGDAENAACIVDVSAFDPFSFRKEQWQDTVPAKHTLEFARAAAIEGMKPYGFLVDEPKIKVDSYDQNRHDLRDSILTDQQDLKGKIAEVRRLGLLYKGRVIRPARVVQYAIDYRKSPSEPVISENKAPVTTPAVEEKPLRSPEPTENAEKKGLSEF